MTDYRRWLDLLADCPGCNTATLVPFGGKYRCPACGYIAPCCDPEPVRNDQMVATLADTAADREGPRRRAVS